MEIHKNKNIKWWIGTLSCVSLFIIIGVFAFMKMNFLIHGVEIKATIHNEEDSSIVNVEGIAANAVYISLNGREIYIDKDGTFKEPVTLLPGLSVVTLDAKDKFGKSFTKEFALIYKENQKVAVVERVINTN